MPWSSMGTILLNNWDWKLFPTSAIGTSQFRIKQTFKQGLIYPSGYFLFGWLCVDSGKYGIRRIYFDNQIDTVFSDVLPNSLFSICATRIPIVKLPRRAKIDQNNIPQIQLFEFF